MALKRLFGRAPAAPTPTLDAPPAHDAASLRTSLQGLVHRVNRSAGRLPVGAVPVIRDTARFARSMVPSGSTTRSPSAAVSSTVR